VTIRRKAAKRDTLAGGANECGEEARRATETRCGGLNERRIGDAGGRGTSSRRDSVEFDRESAL